MQSLALFPFRNPYCVGDKILLLSAHNSNLLIKGESNNLLIVEKIAIGRYDECMSSAIKIEQKLY